ncbi:AMP-dependent synthetase and ligase [Cellulomonas fimi ATCC 484]|uniref:AMP-dependent synthetase and ligase n=1 Tax=Cellulomonas fimi (strain ATCC 484 / DSM 20113 / JCM 1341 / CCUG 24087 / LMG 16345 / NBRC 15513 / NCIMB 8980 / NCTC 7547 / NRS-133) TaxID=590998 RepID=F4H6I2_CELFA|nr:AMP-dependent synthetase and ligase [Cellulomonas fimi ATCC 484]VEH30076.1 phenylacetate-CoA ligase [Cellulomonas fimi]
MRTTDPAPGPDGGPGRAPAPGAPGGGVPDHDPVPVPDPTAATAPDPALVPDPALGEYAAMGSVALTDQERWPTLDALGLARVDAWRSRPDAPVWVHATGDRLRPDDLDALEAVAGRLAAPGCAAAQAADEPAWVRELVARVHETVPRWRRAAREGRSGPGTPLVDLPTTTRSDLSDAAAHVPLDVPLDRVLEGSSSGHTGAALLVPLHPLSVAADLVLLQHLVEATGATWQVDPDRLGLANVVDQRASFTYVSAMTGFRRPPGTPAPVMARVNLHASVWRGDGDRERYLQAADPQVLSTSTLPLLHLLDLAAAGLALHPVAVVNGATDLPPAVRDAVARTWGCPVLDLYGLRETGPVAVSTDGAGHVVVPRRVFVEVLGPDGRRLPDGERGEVVVTVDENPYLPLLRYRTGDTAALVRDARGTVLVGLQGRAPVRFVAADGSASSSIDATQLLQAYGLAGWELVQDVAGDVRLTALPVTGLGADPVATARAAADAVERWLGRPVRLDVVHDPAALGPGKPRRFRSDAVPSTLGKDNP